MRPLSAMLPGKQIITISIDGYGSKKFLIEVPEPEETAREVPIITLEW